MVTRSVQEAIRDPNKTETLYDLMQKGRDDIGMQTFDQHLIDLHRSGVIAAEVATRRATRRSDVEREIMISG